MYKEKFEEDEWLYPRYKLLFVIKYEGEIVYKPSRYGDYTDANPFPPSYIPRVGEQFIIQRRITDGIEGYDNDNSVSIYEVIKLRMKIVETSQQNFQSVCYLDVKQVGTL